MPDAATMRSITTFAIIKGVTIGGIVTAVVHANGLSPFAQALIISLVSAIIGAFGMIIAALIARDSAQRVESKVEETKAHVVEVKEKLEGSEQ